MIKDMVSLLQDRKDFFLELMIEHDWLTNRYFDQ